MKMGVKGDVTPKHFASTSESIWTKVWPWALIRERTCFYTEQTNNLFGIKTFKTYSARKIKVLERIKQFSILLLGTTFFSFSEQFPSSAGWRRVDHVELVAGQFGWTGCWAVRTCRTGPSLQNEKKKRENELLYSTHKLWRLRASNFHPKFNWVAVW